MSPSMFSPVLPTFMSFVVVSFFSFFVLHCGTGVVVFHFTVYSANGSNNLI